MAIGALILVFLGIALILVGTFVSLKEWHREQQAKKDAAAKEGVVTDQAGIGETLQGLAKLADALKNHPLGMQLIIVGITLITLGGILGGVSGLTQ